MIVPRIIFSLIRSYNLRVFSSWISAAFDTLLPHCSGSRHFSSSEFLSATPPVICCGYLPQYRIS